MLKKIFKLFYLQKVKEFFCHVVNFLSMIIHFVTTFLFIYPEEEYTWVGYLDIKRWNITIFTEVEDQSHPLSKHLNSLFGCESLRLGVNN